MKRQCNIFLDHHHIEFGWLPIDVVLLKPDTVNVVLGVDVWLYHLGRLCLGSVLVIGFDRGCGEVVVGWLPLLRHLVRTVELGVIVALNLIAMIIDRKVSVDIGAGHVGTAVSSGNSGVC